jgi:phenylacetate-coenzyme A ligase PaaK-like adenylate-forming protein
VEAHHERRAVLPDAVATGRLPTRFASWEEFATRLPVATRAFVQKEGARLASAARAADWQRTTGGSTSEPVQLPAWHDERRAAHADLWRARDWYGLTPASPLFLLWGHSHLLGTGWQGWLNARRREVLDRMLGYHRFSAYDLRDDAMRAAGDALLRARPAYLLGYSVALDRLARVNASRAAAMRALGLRAVIGAAEAFPSPDSAARLRELFGCAVAMEYGSVETQLLAHTHPDGGYVVMADSYVLEAEPLAHDRQRARVRVTSLTPRAFPLVRYDLGDEIEFDDAPAPHGPVYRFARVVGRCNDYVPLRDGAQIHSEAITHAVRGCAEVLGYQLVQRGDALRLDYLAAAELSAAAGGAVRATLARIHPLLGATELRRVPALQQTRAGKTRMIVRE